MPRATRGRRFPRAPQTLVAPPPVGIYDTIDSEVVRPGLAVELTNCYVPPDVVARGVVGRPGLAVLGAQLGGVGARTVQYLGQFTKQDGTRYTICICGGKFYTLNWGTATWSEAISAATFSGASITVSSTARFFAQSLVDTIAFWDGTNTAWTWDGTTNGGLTKLSNLGVPYGPVTGPYYAKPFFIKATERAAFVWGEEGDFTTGYEAGGYNNAWNPLGGAAFNAIAATNQALYLCEARRTIRITGAVSTDFQTAGTRSDVSETVGTQSPMLVSDNAVVLVSSDGEPYMIRGGMTPLWEPCQAVVATVNRDALGQACIVEWPIIDAVLIGLPLMPNDVVSQWLVYRLSGDTPRYIGRWDLGLNDTGAVVLDSDDTPTFLVAGNDDGYVYQMGQPTGSTWNDAFVSGTRSIPHTVTWQPLGVDADGEKTYDRMTAIFDGSASATQVTYRYRTTRGASTPTTVTLGGGSGDLLGISFVLGTSRFAVEEPEVRKVVGLHAHGRWIAPTWSHDQTSKTFALKRVQVQAYPWGDDPTYP